MKFEEFIGTVKQEVEARIGGTAQIDELIKTNGVERRGLTVLRPGCSVSPTIDLDEYYAQVEGGRKLEEVLEEIAGIYSDSRTMQPVDVSEFYGWDRAKGHIVYRLVNRGENQAMLDNVPYEELLDMAKVYSIIQKSDAHGMLAEVQVTHDMMEEWNVDSAELERHARENTPRELPVSVRALKNPSEILDGGKEELEGIEVYVVSNDTGCMGAAAIGYEGFLGALAEQLDSDLYLLAISVNEAVALKKKERMDIRSLRDTFRKVYSSLPREELLSDSVYCYERQGKSLKLVIPADRFE